MSAQLTPHALTTRARVTLATIQGQASVFTSSTPPTAAKGSVANVHSTPAVSTGRVPVTKTFTRRKVRV